MGRKPDLDPHIRTRICELRNTAKWSYKEIHRAYPTVSLSTIKYTVRKEGERHKNASKPRSSRPRKLTEDDRDHIYEVVTTNPYIQQEDLLTEVDHKVKINSIRRLLYEMDLRKWRQLERPMLAQHHANRRLQWARTYEHFTPEDWGRVYWSDECSIERGIGFRKEYTFTRPCDQIRLRDIRPIPCGKQLRQMFWAAFSGCSRRTGLVPLDGDPESPRGGVNSRVIRDLYQRILPTLFHGSTDAIFMHDNAPTHTAFIVRETLEGMHIEIMDWPPHSPDLNPIENLWGLLKAKIYKLHPELLDMPNNDHTLERLVDAAQEAWDALDLSILVNLSETMPHRVKAIIEADGWYTSY